MKIAAYHGGNNGVSHYRVWNPMKFLERHGYTVRLMPKNTNGVYIPLSGKNGNVPGWESHEAVTRWSDVIFTNFRQNRSETARLIAQSQLRPLVVDLDDDMTNIDPTNGAFGSWQAHPEANVITEIPSNVPSSEIERHKREGWAILEHNGKKYMARDDGAPGWENVIDQVRHAALVTVSTEHLKGVYGRYNENTVVIPNAIDFEEWHKVEPANDGLIRIGLFGSNSHYKDWAECTEAVIRILKEFPQVRLYFNGWLVLLEDDRFKPTYQKERRWRFPDYFDKAGLLEHPQVELFEPCEIEDYPKWLMDKKIDIGLAPLANIVFNKSKSNLKFLEFGAIGVPAVYADLEPFKCVEHGVTGLKAKTKEDYYTHLKTLIEDASLRKRMGDAAHEEVRNNFDADKVAVKLAALIREITKEKRHEDSSDPSDTHAGASAVPC